MDTTTPKQSDAYETVPMSYIAARLDQMGVVLVNYADPVDGSDTPAVDWREMRKVFRHQDETMDRVIRERTRPIMMPEPAPKTATVEVLFKEDRQRRWMMFMHGWFAGALCGIAGLGGIYLWMSS